MVQISKNNQIIFEGLPRAMSLNNDTYIQIDFEDYIDVQQNDAVEIHYEGTTWKGEVISSLKIILPEKIHTIVVKLTS